MALRGLWKGTLLALLLIYGFSPWASEAGIPEVRFWQLSNGFRVLFVPRPGMPFFSAVIYVKAGSVDEQRGETGIAHLLEHMAFKGTPWIGTSDWNTERDVLLRIEEVVDKLQNLTESGVAETSEVEALRAEFLALQKQARKYVIPNEYDRLITLAGGQDVNATTSNDYTNYFMTLPSHKLELWALLESQRLSYPTWREFYQERDVVCEERRMRMEDDPSGRLYEEFIAAAFKAHPYEAPVIGWMSDVQRLTAERVAMFYRRWYVPANMVAVVVGDLRTEDVRTITEKYFGSLLAGAVPPRHPTVEPTQKGSRRITIELDAQPQLVMGWHKPTYPDRDAYILDVLQYVLTDNGRSSRLYTSLVKKKALCESVSSFTAPGERYPNLFCIWATPRAPHTADEVEKAVWDELNTLARESITTSELEMTQNKIESNLVKEMETNLGCARRLGYFFLLSGDPDFPRRYQEELKRVTSADIQAVIQKYLTEQNVTVAEIISKPTTASRKNSASASSGNTAAPSEKSSGRGIHR